MSMFNIWLASKVLETGHPKSSPAPAGGGGYTILMWVVILLVVGLLALLFTFGHPDPIETPVEP